MLLLQINCTDYTANDLFAIRFKNILRSISSTSPIHWNIYSTCCQADPSSPVTNASCLQLLLGHLYKTTSNDPSRPDPTSPSHGSVRHHYSIKPSHKVLAEHFERKAADTHWRKKKQKKPLHKISGDKVPNATVAKENRPRWRYRLKAGFKQDSRVWINSHEQIFQS